MDTNSVIEFLGGALSNKAIEWLESIVENKSHTLSVINRIELLSYAGKSGELKILEEFIASAIEYPLSEDIINQTITISRQIKIKLPDAIIAATALIENCTLLTRNVKDFRDLPSLEILNLHDIK